MKKLIITVILLLVLLTVTGCNDTSTIQCNDNQDLVDGVCVDKTEVPECTADQELVDGVCEDKVVPPTCTDDQELVDGVCEDIVTTPTCSEDQELIDNECVDIDPCNTNQMLVDDVCVDIPPIDIIYPVEELLDDFDEAVFLLDAVNPKTFADEEEIELIIETQRALITEDMTEFGFLRILAPVVTAYNCGHTHVGPSDASYEYNVENAIIFPLITRLIEGELYVIDEPTGENIVLGSKITSINGKTFDDILLEFGNFLSTEGSNISSLHYDINYYFSYYYHSRIDQSETYDIDYIEYGTNEVKSITLDGITVDDLPEGEEWVRFDATYTDTYALMTLNSFYSNNSTVPVSLYTDFFDTFFTEVDTRGIDHVIIDLRDNGGGTDSSSSKLLAYILNTEQAFYDSSCSACGAAYKGVIEFNTPHFDGNLYTLISGGSFSQTGLFASIVKYQDIGVFIGEDTESSYITNGSSNDYYLHNTKIYLKIGDEVFYTAVDGLALGEGIHPDYIVHMTIEDYLNGTDSVLEYAIDMIENGGS